MAGSGPQRRGLGWPTTLLEPKLLRCDATGYRHKGQSLRPEHLVPCARSSALRVRWGAELVVQLRLL